MTPFCDGAKKKVVIGMSGGVDSSVAAALLVRSGFEVVGMTMKLWHYESLTCPASDNLCCSLESVEAARRISRKLGIDYFVINCEDRFKKEVVDDFIYNYSIGMTPNPCVVCNEKLKFGHFDSKAQILESDYVATGHYASCTYDNASGRYLLSRAFDKKKDQTYVLYRLNQEQLKRTIFPLENMTKAEVREMAKELDIEVADKPESQDVCFVPGGDYRQFLKEYVPALSVKGDIVDVNGKVLGKHDGIAMYTIGQRKGLGSLSETPMYVTEICVEENKVVVGKACDTKGKSLIASRLNFIAFDKLTSDMRVGAKIRYKSQEASATIIPIDDDRVKVVFDEDQNAITAGQSVVFYDGDLVVGGGIIEKDQ